MGDSKIPRGAGAVSVTTRLRADVAALCSPACAGRAPGSAEGARARAFIREGFAKAGLPTSEQPVPGCGGANVIARVAGRGPRTVLVGAHYDHLGRAPNGVPYWGADDNAAAVALLLELARTLAPRQGDLEGSVLLVAFDGEEPPHFLTSGMGSMELVAHPPVPLADLDLMVALDLVGHAVGPPQAPPAVRESLFLLGAEKSRGTAEMAREAARDVAGLTVRPLGIDVLPPLSDYEPFRRASVPFLFLTAGRYRHYHEVTDTPDRLDHRKIAAIHDLVLGLIEGALGRSARPRYDERSRDDTGTVRTLAGLARDLAGVLPAEAAAEALEAIQRRLDRDPLPSLRDWSTLLQILARLEQGLA
jgi:Zn-dependent M28 family amino/carboxypeptidase